MQKRQNSPTEQPHFGDYNQVNSDLAKVIIEYALPLLQQCKTYEAREGAISYAILGWNLSLENETERENLMTEIFKPLSAEENEQIQQLFTYLIKRKNELYPDNRFYIIDYELKRHGEKMEIKVVTKYIARTQAPD